MMTSINVRGTELNMVERTDANDSSEIVTHARKATFVLTIVCILAVVASYIRDTDRLERAVNELDFSLELIGHIHKNSPNGGPYPLDQVIMGSLESDSASVSQYKLTLNSDRTSKDNGGSESCELILNQTRQFFATMDGYVNGATVRISPDGHRKILTTNFAANSAPWSPIDEIPRDIVGFKRLWNALASSNQSARIASIQPQNGLLFLISDEFGSRRMVIREIDLSTGPFPKAGNLQHLGNTGAVSKEGIGDRLSDFAPRILLSDKRDVNLLRRYRDSWENDKVEALATGFCLFDADTTAAENGAVVIVPARLEYESFDWNGEWFSAIGKKVDFELGTFDVAFPNLDQEMRDFERLSNDEVRRLLVERIDLVGQATGNVSFFGIAVQAKRVLALSIAIIVIFQLYATRHLAEATRRMRASELGDPGAYVPWILLYSHPVDVVGSIVIASFPSVSAAIVLFRTTGGLVSWPSPFDYFNASVVIISVFLTILFLQKARNFVGPRCTT